MISQQAKDFLKLVLRSPNTGDGWRDVGKMLWPSVVDFEAQELLESSRNDDGTGKVRLSETGLIVARYLT
jgi:hypothetical protein